MSHRFIRGKVDQTLFIKKEDGELIVAQVYVNDIIFGLTKDELAHGFSKLMQAEFEMSMIEELRADSLPWIADSSTRFRYIPI